MIYTDENGKKFKDRSGNCGDIWIREIPEKKTFSWDDVADGVLVYYLNHDVSISDEFHFKLHADAREGCKKWPELGLRFSTEWNVWLGSSQDCPLPNGVEFEVKIADVEENDIVIKTLNKVRAGCVATWDYSRPWCKIIAYRVVKLADNTFYPDEME